MREMKFSITFKAEECDFDKITEEMSRFLADVKEVLEYGIEFPSRIEVKYEGDKEI